MRAACGIERVVRHPIWLVRKGVNLERFMLELNDDYLFDHMDQTCASGRTAWPDWWLRLAGSFGPESAHVCWRSVRRSASPLFSHRSRFTPYKLAESCTYT